MASLKSMIQSWKQDYILKRVVGNSSYLFISNIISAILSIVSASLLGVTNFGVLGIITGFAVGINNLLSFRMSEVVVKYMGEALAKDEKTKAAAIVKAAAMAEATFSLVAYGTLILLAPLGAKYIAKDPAFTSLFILYGGIILANIVTETSTGVLQVTGHFRGLAVNNLLQSIVVAGLIVVAAARGSNLEEVLWAYLIGKIILGVGPLLLALFWLPQSLGKDWWKASLRELPRWRGMLRFAVSTNVSGTINVFARDSEVQWIGFFYGPTIAGYFKAAIALVGLVVIPIDPYISTVYPEITRAYARRQWERLRSLINRVTLISLSWTGAVAVGLVLFGKQVLFSNWTILGHTFHIYKPEYLPAFPILMIILIGYGTANTLFWNRAILLAQGKATEALWIAFSAMVVKVSLALLILPHAPYIAEAYILSFFFISSVGINVWRGLTLINRKAKKEPMPLPGVGTGLVPEPQDLPLEKKARWKPPRFSAPGINLWDWLVVIIFLLYSSWYFLGRLEKNYPVVILSGDGGNIASYAAAQDHQDWFKNDPALGEGNNTGIYATIQIPLIRTIQDLTGDYGQAYAWLVLPTTFLQLLGFYLLGRVLFRNRFWAFLLAFLTAMMVINFGLGEIWGVWRDALPRVTFQAVLPFLLAASLYGKDQPEYWPWLMIFAGLMVYLHPISAPAWGFAIWLGLWFSHPPQWNWQRRCLVMLGLGFLFILPIIPYAMNYFGYQSRGQAADYATVMEVLKTYAPANLLNPVAALGEFLWNMTRNLLLPLAAVGFGLTWWLKKNDRSQVKQVLAWMAGIFAVSILVPGLERIIEARLHKLPFETELVRCIRYLIPLMLLFWLWPLAEWTKRITSVHASRAVGVLGIVLFGYWAGMNRPDLSAMLRVVTCLTKGQLVCRSDRPMDGLLDALRTKTQPGEGVLFFNEDPATTSQTISVRYAALRPLVFTERDSGLLSYSNRTALPAWLETEKKWEALRALSDPQDRLDRLVPLADSLGATYLVIDFSLPEGATQSLQVTPIFQNEAYLMLKLH